MAKFQNIEAESLSVESQITLGGKAVTVEGHRHTTNEIDNIDKYFAEKLNSANSLTVNDSLHFCGRDIGQFFQTDIPIYNQMQQTISVPLEVVTPNRDMFIKLNDGILLQKELIIYLNNKKIIYNKENDILKFEDNKYLTGDNTLQLLIDTNNQKYLYFKNKRETLLLINSSEVMQAIKETDLEYDAKHFNLSDGGIFKSCAFFEEEQSELPVPFIIGKTNPLKLKKYQKMNIDVLEQFMFPKKNFALVFITKDEKACAFYIDKESYTYTYAVQTGSISLYETNCVGAYQLKLSDEFKESLNAVYLFSSTTINEDSPSSSSVGFIANSNATTDLTPFMRTITLSKSQIEFLNTFKELYLLESKDIEEHNTILNIILANKLTTINNVKFHPGDTITITAKAEGGNADTLNNLTADNYILKTDVVDTDGKIARFNSSGHLVYPDGHEEWIE